MKKILFLTCLLSVVFVANAFANGLSLNSIGPKALGMGGAFVGLADDGTAIYWNPAGLAGQDNCIMFAGTDIIPFGSYKLDAYGIDAESEMNHYVGPNLFVNYNLGKIGLGFGVYVPAGVGVEWDGKDLVAFSGPDSIDLGPFKINNPYYGKTYEWMSEIGVINISPAISYQLYDNLSIGVAANVYYGMLELKRGEDKINILEAYGVPEDGMLDTQTAFDIAGLGYGATIGLMYKMSDIVSLGITYRTPINVAFEGDADIDLPGLDTVDGSIDIEWPMWLGAGLAVKANDKLTLTCDAQYSQWSSLEELDAEIKLPAAYGGTTIQKMHLEWEDATQIRLGLAYELNENLTVLHGWYFDPGPSPDETLTILFPSQTYSVVTGGLCYKINNFDVDFGIEYLFGVDRNIKAAEHNMPGVHQMDIFAVSLGLGYSF